MNGCSATVVFATARNEQRSTMRFIATLCLVLLGGAAACRAAEHAGADGFSICRFDFQQCEPVTDAAMQSRHLSAAKIAIVGKLRHLAVAPDKAALDALAPAFAPPQRPVDTEKIVDLWYPDPHVVPPARCFVCGIHLRYFGKELAQVNYGVSEKFLLLWNRVLASKPER